jgi:hypothetical protein
MRLVLAYVCGMDERDEEYSNDEDGDQDQGDKGGKDQCDRNENVDENNTRTKTKAARMMAGTSTWLTRTTSTSRVQGGQRLALLICSPLSSATRFTITSRIHRAPSIDVCTISWDPSAQAFASGSKARAA